jgi:hypothetical protein
MSSWRGQSPDTIISHDNVLSLLTSILEEQEYYVQANNVMCKNGRPQAYYGFVPDLVATAFNKNIIIEIEDCSTYERELTRERLSAFSRVPGYVCYVMVPEFCPGYMGRKPDLKMKKYLESWNLTNIRVGVYNSVKGTITLSAKE